MNVFPVILKRVIFHDCSSSRSPVVLSVYVSSTALVFWSCSSYVVVEQAERVIASGLYALNPSTGESATMRKQNMTVMTTLPLPIVRLKIDTP